jgi:PAS domain S-box-containing protein
MLLSVLPEGVPTLIAIAVMGLSLLIFAWNLTLRRKVRLRTEALAGSESQLRALTENSPDVILRLSQDGRVLFANAAVRELWARGSAEVTGKKIYELGLGQEFADVWQRNIDMVIRTGEALDSEWITQGPQPRVFSGRWFPEPDAHGRALNALAVWRDVTERRAVEDERRRIEGELYEVQKLESLGVLAGSVAHDFNNHLTAILGNVEVALQAGDISTARPALQRAQGAIRQASELCRQMSKFSRKGTSEAVVMDLSSLVAEMTSLLAASLPRGVDLQIACDPQIAAIEADPSQIRQLILNIMINAAASLQGRSGVVLLRATSVELPRESLASIPEASGLVPGTFVLLEISDNGAGLDEAGMQQLFQPFFTPQEDGRGLGLAVARAIVQAHGGFLQASSAPDQGTTVQAYFPASSRAPVVVANAAEPSNTAGKVLLIDDDAAVLNATSRLLEKIGLTSVTAGDGVQGLEKFLIHRDEVTLVILDLNMPYMNGAETLKNLRESGCNAQVIVASGFSQLLITQEMRALGIAAFLEKPYTFDTLARTVERVLGSAVPVTV